MEFKLFIPVSLKLKINRPYRRLVHRNDIYLKFRLLRVFIYLTLEELTQELADLENEGRQLDSLISESGLFK